jgi:dihydrofolate reductase
VKLAIIAAVARNRAIGKDGKLPWHISEDLKRFKHLTTGHAVLMGRKTYESIGRPLPDRRNVVVTTHPITGIETYPSVPAALDALAAESTVYVIGGGTLYAQLLDRADELHLTMVDREVKGDIFFPPYEHLLGRTFTLERREKHDGYSFVDYRRTVSD